MKFTREEYLAMMRVVCETCGMFVCYSNANYIEPVYCSEVCVPLEVMKGLEG